MKGRIEVRGVAKSYGTGRSARRVVEDCSFAVAPGEPVVMIGPTGAGKSTLVRLLAGYEAPTAGEILIDGKPVRGPGPDRMVVFQESALFPWMTTEQNILFGPTSRGERGNAAIGRARTLLERTGLAAFRKKYPSQLSGGMQRRAELARALIDDPAVTILDEPFRGLDAMTRKLMIEYHARLHAASPRTSLFVTTDIDEAIVLGDRLLIMGNIPTRVRTEIVVDLPRPRRPSDIAGDDRANAIKVRALSVLQEEALRAFASPAVTRPAA